MGKKGGKYKKKATDSPKLHDAGEDDLMNDEIDAFHKQRDIIPLDVNEGEAESDEDIDQPVFDVEDDDDDDEDNSEDDTGLAAKIATQQKHLRAQVGGVEDESDEDVSGEDNVGWGRSKGNYYNNDTADYEILTDEELTREEEVEVLRMQKEKAKSYTEDDFGVEDISKGSDKELTYEEILAQGKPLPNANLGKKTEDDSTTAYEKVTKDLNEMTREEQMDVVLSSAPELIGLLSEFGDALEELENKVNPLLNKIRDANMATPAGIEYVQMKQQLLLSYCQAITFYLLLKSEGQTVRDHPVISRLVEIKSLLDKTRELDKYLPPQLEDILVRDQSTKTVEKEVEKKSMMKPCPATEVNQSTAVPVHIPDKSVAHEGSRVADEIPIIKHKLNKSYTKQQDNEVGMQSQQMLKVRAALEQKLREKGLITSIANVNEGTRKRRRPVNGQLETLDDFDDDAMDLDKVNNQSGMRNDGLVHARKLSKLVSRQGSKPKVISGDDDLPKRDDIGERRRKHELRVLAGAGIKSADDVDDMPLSPQSDGDSDGSDGGSDGSGGDSGLEFYNQVKEKHSAKLAAKSQKYSRSVNAEPLSEPLVDGKRQISYQMEKNRGLTRSRKKLTKNPRKKYKLKHDKIVKNRKGQVRDIRKQTGPYGGETTGINATVTRSRKLNS